MQHRDEDQNPSHAAVGDLLAQAAARCVEQGLDLEAFLQGAWTAYLEARPGLREHLEELRLRQQLEEIREAGRMAQA